jgi:hypothetical protein
VCKYLNQQRIRSVTYHADMEPHAREVSVLFSDHLDVYCVDVLLVVLFD